MQNRLLNGGCLVLASTVAIGAVVAAQAPHDAPERMGRCFPPVTTTGVYVEVTADGPTEQSDALDAALPDARDGHRACARAGSRTQL